jgi:23S rRNA (cytosine1962-C5)-methyltransferase
MVKIFLKKGREKPVINGHPWVFSGAIHKVDGEKEPGAPCMVVDTAGAVLGHGYFNEKSSITVRMLTKGDTPFTASVLTTRIEQAVAARMPILSDTETDSCRLVNAEGDFLPGLIVDRFAAGLSVQILTYGMERMRHDIMAVLGDQLAPSFVVERSDTEARQREGLPACSRLLTGKLPSPLIIIENGIKFEADIEGGQKTGFFFDQRANRLLVRAYASGRRGLDCFSYSGGFCLNMLSGGAAAVTAVDSSKDALAWCRRNIAANGADGASVETQCADVFNYLRTIEGRFDLIVLDPPKFAKHPMEVPKASRGYKDINLVAMKNILPGGILFTFSCSNAVDVRLFRQIVFAAAADSGRQVQVLHVLSAGPDHPFNIAHQEGEYLKGLVLRVF